MEYGGAAPRTEYLVVQSKTTSQTLYPSSDQTTAGQFSCLLVDTLDWKDVKWLILWIKAHSFL